jgi:hypothetical protein
VGVSLGSDDTLSRMSVSTISTGSEDWGEEDSGGTHGARLELLEVG